jgi:hypothetical protein|tara:strand:- start:1284 stop:1493 length:210 start_codon:yes stop_codon:yes gene_type:complete
MNLKEKIDIQLKECIKAFNIVLDDSIKHNNDNILNCDVNIDFLERHAKEIVFICENMRSFKKLEKKYSK